MPGLVQAVVEDPYESRRSSAPSAAPALVVNEPGLMGCLRAFEKRHVVVFGLVKAWIIVGLYILVGILMYVYALGEPWTVIDTMYFSVTTMSTVALLVEKLAAGRWPQPPPPAPPPPPPPISDLTPPAPPPPSLLPCCQPPPSRPATCRSAPAILPCPTPPRLPGEGRGAQENPARAAADFSSPHLADVRLPAFPQVGYGDLYPSGPYSRAPQRVPKRVATPVACARCVAKGHAWGARLGRGVRWGTSSSHAPPPAPPSAPPSRLTPACPPASPPRTPLPFPAGLQGTSAASAASRIGFWLAPRPCPRHPPPPSAMSTSATTASPSSTALPAPTCRRSLRSLDRASRAFTSSSG